jgi:hypothetical protein
MIEIEYELTLQGESKMTQEEYYNQLLAMRGNTREETTKAFDLAVRQMANWLAKTVYSHDMPAHLYLGSGDSEVTKFVGLKILKGYDKPSMTIHMPCGEELVIPILVPAEDVPCPCGKANHIMVEHVDSFVVPETDFGKDLSTSECACCHQVIGVSQSVLVNGQELCKECAK